MPEGPSSSTPEQVREALTEPSGTEAGLDLNLEEGPTAKQHVMEALGHAIEAGTIERAAKSEAIGELAVHEVVDAIDRGVDPAEALAAGLSSRALSQDQVEELAWQQALAAEGFDSDEDLGEFGDDETDEAVERSFDALLGTAEGLASYEVEARQHQEAARVNLETQLANEKLSNQALHAYQRELGLNGDEMRGLLVSVDAELEGGLLGTPVNLEALAVSDPKAFDAILRSAASTYLQGGIDDIDRGLKERILDQEKDISSGLTIDGRPVREKPQLGLDEERFVDKVVERSQRRPHDVRAALKAPTKDVKSGFSVGDKAVHIDDVPLEGGGTARSRAKERESRGGRAS